MVFGIFIIKEEKGWVYIGNKGFKILKKTGENE